MNGVRAGRGEHAAKQERKAPSLTGLVAEACGLLTAGALLGLLSLPAMAGTPGGKNEAVKAGTTTSSKPRLERSKEEKEKAGESDRDRKYLPPGDADWEGDEGAVQGHAAWRWHLLTYPKDTIPAQAYTRARQWIREKVREGKRWQGVPGRTAVRGEGAIAIQPDVWTPVGPKPIDMSTQPAGYVYGHVTGRVNALAVDPRSTVPGEITAYAGASSGGFWKSTNCCGAGTAWAPLWEDNVAVTQAVGAIEIDPNDPDVVYVGTGDFDAADQFGEGVMKTTDGGVTWMQLGADVFTPYAEGTPRWSNQNIGVIKVDPNHSDTVLVGTRYDLYISHDAGQRWTRCVFGANPTDPTQASNPTNAINRISGILLDPTTSPTTVYVAVGYVSSGYNGDNGVYKGTLPAQGVPTLTLMNTGWPTGTGNGVNGGTRVGRISLASSRGNTSNNLVIYAQVEDSDNLNALGTWVTTDQGQHWSLLSGSTDVNYKNCRDMSTGEGQDWYDLFLMADPGNDKILYVGRTDLYKAVVSSDYTSMAITSLGNVYSSYCQGYGTLHPDQHGAAWVSGTGGSAQFLVGNDGGIYLANGSTGGFTQLNDSVNVTQWYAGQTGADMAGGGTQYYFAGAQDNGNAGWDSSNTDLTWQARGNGGDGFFAAFDPIAGSLTSGRWYTEYVYGDMSCSTTGAASGFSGCSGAWRADRAPWSAPFKLDVFHCTTGQCNDLIFGAAHLWASTSKSAPAWKMAGKSDLTKGQGSIITLDVAISSPTSVVVGTDDGTVQWSNTVFKGKKCTQTLANTDTFKCKANKKAQWTNLAQGNAILPNRAILGVAFDPTTDQIVYAAVGGFNANTPATPGHVFQCVNLAGTWTWKDKTGNLPDVPAWSIVINPNNPAQAFLGTEMGFYTTNDINAAVPVWTLYQYGLPNTVIQYLTVDRGPASDPYASTTLTAFTYGRGAYSILLPGPTGFPGGS